MHLKVTGGGKRQRANCNLEEQTDLIAFGTGAGCTPPLLGGTSGTPTNLNRGINLTTEEALGSQPPPRPSTAANRSASSSKRRRSGDKVRESVSCSSLDGELKTSGVPRCLASSG